MTTVSESVVRRLRASKDNSKPEDLSILDQLAVPRTFDDLIMQIQDNRECRMFFPMVGLPRAYMEIPILMEPDLAKALAKQVWGTSDVYMERWVYQVLLWGAEGTRAKTEKRLCEHFWKKFIALRKKYNELYPGADPVIVWRRPPEFEEAPTILGTAPCFEHGVKRCRRCSHGPQCFIYMRFAIPGLDLHPSKDPDFMTDTMDRKSRLLPKVLA